MKKNRLEREWEIMKNSKMERHRRREKEIERERGRKGEWENSKLGEMIQSERKRG
jgi:hypothetical protein